MALDNAELAANYGWVGKQDKTNTALNCQPETPCLNGSHGGFVVLLECQLILTGFPNKQGKVMVQGSRQAGQKLRDPHRRSYELSPRNPPIEVRHVKDIESLLIDAVYR